MPIVQSISLYHIDLALIYNLMIQAGGEYCENRHEILDEVQFSKQ